MTTKATAAGDEVPYRVCDDEGEFVVKVPQGAKLTFGPDVPFTSKKEVAQAAYNNMERARSYALRVYLNGKDNLIACFPRVHWFRPEAMAVERQIVGKDGMFVDVPTIMPPRPEVRTGGYEATRMVQVGSESIPYRRTWEAYPTTAATVSGLDHDF